MGDPLTIFQVVTFIASVVYQRNQAKKLKEQQARAAEAAKDSAATRNVRISGSNLPIPLLYGETRVDSTNVYTSVSNSFDSPSPNSTEVILGTLSGFTGSKNELLVLQSVLSAGSITDVVHMELDSYSYADSKFIDWVKSYISLSGGVKNNSSNLNRESTATFDELAYATEFFRMNRDEPQFSGKPSTSYLLRGRKIRTFSGSTYLTTKSYSFNAIEVLLDYLLDTDYGAELTLNDIDIESFANARAIAAQVVKANATTDGFLGLNRDLLRHEFHGAIYPDVSHLDNIASILDTIPGAIFIRTTEGKLKISIPDPGLVTPKDESTLSVGEITDEYLISDVKFSQQDTNERFNSVKVNYPNVSKDFASDSFEYENGSYLSQDYGLKLSSDLTINGINNIFQAEAYARASVNESRLPVYSFTMSHELLSFEPGDIVRLNSERNDIDAYIRIVSMNMKDDFSIEVEAVYYDSSVFFWNSTAVDSVTNYPTFDFELLAPSGLNANVLPNPDGVFNSIKLTWSVVDDFRVHDYVIEAGVLIGASTVYSVVGTVLDSMSDNGTLSFIYSPTYLAGYTFRVRARTRLGQLTPWSGATQETFVTASMLLASLYVDISNQNILINRNLETGATLPITPTETFSVRIGADTAEYLAEVNPTVIPAYNWRITSSISGNLANSQGSYDITVTDNVATLNITLDQESTELFEQTSLAVNFQINPTSEELATNDSKIINLVRNFYLIETSEGVPGSSSFTCVIYLISNTVPNTPVGGSYDFSTRVITPPTGWLASFPNNTDPTKIVYRSEAIAFVDKFKTVDSTLTWTNPVQMVKSGIDAVPPILTRLDSDYRAFRIDLNNNADIAAITFTDVSLNVPGGSTPVWSSTGCTLTTEGLIRKVYYNDMTSTTASVTLSYDGVTDTITIVKLRDGDTTINAILSNEVQAVPASADGTVLSYTGANTAIYVFEGSQDATSEYSFVKVDGSGVTSTLTANSLSLTALTNAVPGGIVTITGTRANYPDIVKVFTVVKSLQGVDGEKGDTGDPGSQGARGAGWWRMSNSESQATLNSYSSSSITTLFKNNILAAGPVTNDIFIISGAGTAVKAWIYSGSSWSVQAEFIDGNLLVSGTVTASYLNADSLSVTGVSNLGVITAGLLKSSDSKFVIDLNQKYISIST